jgi:hypothetical protein
VEISEGMLEGHWSHMYLNLTLEERSSYVYRIVSISRLYDFFRTKRNTLVKPVKWDDPFENFILKSKVRHRSGEICEYCYHDSVYGQCWTLQKASDAMWRIYSPDSKSVRIRSKIDDLFNSLRASDHGAPDGMCCIGKVKYLRREKMKKFAGLVYDDSGIRMDKLFSSLLVKRPAFKHEREIRLLYFEVNDDRAKQDTISYEIDPHSVVSQIMLDPRLSMDDTGDLKREIRKRTGFSGRVKRSLLYAPPDDMIVDVTDDFSIE